MRITKLDGLRGVFSLMVVFYHYPAEYISESFHQNFLVSKSYLFVDFFFVLSGFVIAYNYDAAIYSRKAFWEFMKKRFIRLYPLLLFSTLICFAVFFLFRFFFSQYVNPEGGYLKYAYDTANTLLFLNSTPLLDNGSGMNYPSWSISAEMIAYIFYALVTLFFAAKYKREVLLVSILVGVVFLSTREFTGIDGNYNFIRGIVGFNIGYFVWLSRQVNLKINNYWELFLCLLFVSVFYFMNSVLDPILTDVYEACLIPLFFGGAIFLLLHSDGVVSRLMDTPLFQFLGKISYSIYLNHAILILIVPKAAFAFLKLEQSLATEIGVLVLSILLLLIYSNYTYNWIEVKCGKILKGIWLKPRSVPKDIPTAS